MTDTRETNSREDDWHVTTDLHAEHGKGDPFAAAVRATRMPPDFAGTVSTNRPA